MFICYFMLYFGMVKYDERQFEYKTLSEHIFKTKECEHSLALELPRAVISRESVYEITIFGT